MIQSLRMKSGSGGSCVRMLNINDSIGRSRPCRIGGNHHMACIAFMMSIMQELKTADHCSVNHPIICPTFGGPMQHLRARLQCILRTLKRNIRINQSWLYPRWSTVIELWKSLTFTWPSSSKLCVQLQRRDTICIPCCSLQMQLQTFETIF